MVIFHLKMQQYGSERLWEVCLLFSEVLASQLIRSSQVGSGLLTRLDQREINRLVLAHGGTVSGHVDAPHSFHLHQHTSVVIETRSSP